MVCLSYNFLQAQTNREIITDYRSYWKFSSTVLHPIKRDNSHNLFSFFNGTRYSTTANNALLISHGETFVAGDYKALRVKSVTGTLSRLKKTKDLLENFLAEKRLTLQTKDDILKLVKYCNAL